MAVPVKKILKDTAYLPVHVLSLATEAKSFRDNPVIGNRFLNMLGLHVVRLVLAHAVFRAKLFFLSPFADAQDRRDYLANGFVLKENYLPDDQFKQLCVEARSYQGEAWQCVQGNTITWRAMMHGDMLNDRPASRALLSDKKFLGLLKYTAGRNEDPMFYIQQIQNGYGKKGASDPQKVLHADTFHPTMKAWLFLEDVGPRNGPFTYVAGSNRLTWKRLVWEYKRSLVARRVHDGYSEKGSFRVMDDELSSLNLPAPKGLSVKANTLVVANTCGFHRRGDTDDMRATRLEIWAYSRCNPFNPWPGLGIGAFARLRDAVYLRMLRHADKREKARGRKSKWHAAPPSPINDV